MKNLEEIRTCLDATRQRVDAVRLRTDAVRLRYVFNQQEMGTEARLKALLHRHEFMARAMLACERNNMHGQVAAFLPALEQLEAEIGSYERRLGL